MNTDSSQYQLNHLWSSSRRIDWEALSSWIRAWYHARGHLHDNDRDNRFNLAEYGTTRGRGQLHVNRRMDRPASQLSRTAANGGTDPNRTWKYLRGHRNA